MTAEQRRAWFDAVPGSEATYNKILEDARKKHMAMRQGDGTGSRGGSPVPSGAGSRQGSPAPTGGPGSPAAVGGKEVRPAMGQTAAGAQARPPVQGAAASGTRTIRPVNQNMPLPNLAIPPGARRGSAEAPSTPTTATTTMPENRPPAGIHSLSQDKIRFYMSLSDAQGQVLPHDQKQLWLWLKKLIQETKQQTANKAAAGTPQRPGVRPGMTAGQPGSYGAGFRMPSAPGGLSMANLNEEISKLYTDGKAPTMAQLRELCMRGGLSWSAQMENAVAPYASDRAKHQAMTAAGSGMKMDPIEVPQTPMGGPGPVVARTLKEHVHENVRRVVEYEVGNPVDDDLVTVSVLPPKSRRELTHSLSQLFEGLAADLYNELLSGSASLAKSRRREAPSLDVRDVAEIARELSRRLVRSTFLMVHTLISRSDDGHHHSRLRTRAGADRQAESPTAEDGRATFEKAACGTESKGQRRWAHLVVMSRPTPTDHVAALSSCYQGYLEATLPRKPRWRCFMG
jgi:hypothetical protein